VGVKQCHMSPLLLLGKITEYPRDLVRKPRFVDPFILACHSRHAKLAGIGVVCLQRLVASRSLPSERLKDVLGGLKETTSLSKQS
jgi:hypothetical protein